MIDVLGIQIGNRTKGVGKRNMASAMKSQLAQMHGQCDRHGLDADIVQTFGEHLDSSTCVMWGSGRNDNLHIKPTTFWEKKLSGIPGRKPTLVGRTSSAVLLQSTLGRLRQKISRALTHPPKQSDLQVANKARSRTSSAIEMAHLARIQTYSMRI